MLFLNSPGRKLIGLLLTLGVRSCSFESSLPDNVLVLTFGKKVKWILFPFVIILLKVKKIIIPNFYSMIIKARVQIKNYFF